MACHKSCTSIFWFRPVLCLLWEGESLLGFIEQENKDWRGLHVEMA
jgi:hypothetical protein